jgi:hypothetical protein
VALDTPDERQTITALCAQLNSVADASGAPPGCQALAAIMTAARYAGRSSMPAPLAAAMLADYIVRGESI